MLSVAIGECVINSYACTEGSRSRPSSWFRLLVVHSNVSKVWVYLLHLNWSLLWTISCHNLSSSCLHCLVLQIDYFLEIPMWLTCATPTYKNNDTKFIKVLIFIINSWAPLIKHDCYYNHGRHNKRTII